MPLPLVDPNVSGGLAGNFRLDLTPIKAIATATSTFILDIRRHASPIW
jgi:hypothetical protein